MSPLAQSHAEFTMRSHLGNLELQESIGGAGMRDKVAAVRDTMIVMAFQMILRASLMMRRWNY
jgi:hypothetical protein